MCAFIGLPHVQGKSVAGMEHENSGGSPALDRCAHVITHACGVCDSGAEFGEFGCGVHSLNSTTNSAAREWYESPKRARRLLPAQ